MNKTSKETNSVEFGWNGHDGFCRKDGLYNLFYDKPDLGHFVYDAVFFSTNHPEDNFKVLNNVTIALTEDETMIVHDFAVDQSKESPWVYP